MRAGAYFWLFTALSPTCRRVGHEHGQLPVHMSWLDEQTQKRWPYSLLSWLSISATHSCSMTGKFLFPMYVPTSPERSCLCSPYYFPNCFPQLLFSCFCHRHLLLQVTHVDLKLLTLVAEFLAANHMCHPWAPQCLQCVNDISACNSAHNSEIQKYFLIANISIHCITLL